SRARDRVGRWLIPDGLINDRNVKLSLWCFVLGALATTIAHGHIFTVYIYELYGDNT
ncbi:unnamed protein product, partial [Polarella glacialis]